MAQRTKNKSNKLRIIILLILSKKNPNYINQDILSGVKFETICLSINKR